MTDTLTPAQSAALLDILSHYDTYAEIRDFRFPGSLNHYGPPFATHSGHPSTSPALQTLVTKYLLTLPGLRDLPPDWWKVQCHDIIEKFEQSNLSESYDKGSIGSRKTLATAISALIEYPVRGTFGGFAQVKDGNANYDVTKAGDLGRAFRDFMDGCIYGSVLEETVYKAAETDDLNEHSQLIRAVHEFVLVNLASLMHYTLVLSPKGQYLLKLIENANKLVPYMVIKQTLKIGNVASMMSAMVRVVLAKVSVSSITNWVGLTSGADEGMNLLQHIISQVLHWDIRDLEHRASKIEKEHGKHTKEQLHVLKAYPTYSREEQDRLRKKSQNNSISIVTAVLQDKNTLGKLTDHHHEQALEYLSIQLSIRDRKEIISTLCHANPDYFTQSIRELVDAYYPVIREMHKAINLSGTVGDMEYFIKDMIKLAKIHPDHHAHVPHHGNSTNHHASIPTVGDFVMLLCKHQFSCHTFIHQACKNGPDLTDWYLSWAKSAAAEFKRPPPPADNPDPTHPDAGKLNTHLTELFNSLSEATRTSILPILDAQTRYLDDMHASSRVRLTSVLHSPPSKDKHIASIFSTSSAPSSRPPSRPQSPRPGENRTDAPQPSHAKPPPGMAPPIVTGGAGPGAFLARWQDILDHTPVTPHSQKGKPQAASSGPVVEASAKDVDGEKMVSFETSKEEKKNNKEQGQVGGGMKKPDVRIVVEAMGEGFRRLLAERSCTW